MNHMSDSAAEAGANLTPNAHKCFINTLFWNIHGQNTKTIGNKFADGDFLSICKEADLLGIVELHTNEKPSIKGFTLIKDKIRKKNHKGPKISGGVAVFAKAEIAHMVQHVRTNNEDSIWVKLPKEETGEAADMLCESSEEI